MINIERKIRRIIIGVLAVGGVGALMPTDISACDPNQLSCNLNPGYTSSLVSNSNEREIITLGNIPHRSGLLKIGFGITMQTPEPIDVVAVSNWNGPIHRVRFTSDDGWAGDGTCYWASELAKRGSNQDFCSGVLHKAP